MVTPAGLDGAPDMESEIGQLAKESTFTHPRVHKKHRNLVILRQIGVKFGVGWGGLVVSKIYRSLTTSMVFRNIAIDFDLFHMKIVRFCFLASFFIASHGIAAQQPLTLAGCREAAVSLSPLTVRKGLAGQRREMQNKAASSALIPQLELNAQGSYQNEVPKFPGDLPMPVAIDLPRDQYRATVDLNQVIYGGSSVRNTRKANSAAERVEQASLDVQLDRLRDRINETYMGILLTDRQLEVNRLMQQTLASDIKVVTEQMKYGTATGGSRAALDARLLELHQQQAELEGTRGKLTEALSVLTGLPVTGNTPLEVPATGDLGVVRADVPSERTELKLYARQREQIESQNKLLNSRSNPKLSLFASGGYGRPGYNFLDRNFAPMAIGGLRFNMPLTGWDATQKEKKANLIQSRSVDEQQRDFERNAAIETAQYVTEINQLQQVTAMDPQIVSARCAVRMRAMAQLKGGIITDSEYLTEFNNEASARVNAEVNALRLVQAWVNYQAALGLY